MVETVTVALRTADGRLAEQVAQVVAWWEGRLVVRPPGAPPPPADVHIDSALERSPADPPWARQGGIDVVSSVRAAATGPAGGADAARVAATRGAIRLPEGVHELADAIAASLAGSGNRTIAVLSSRGGAGASVTAALLARALADDGRGVALVDLAGDLEQLLGLEEEPGPRWADLDPEAAPFVGHQLIDVLPRWARVPTVVADARGRIEAVPAVLAAVREVCSVVLLDVGRGPLSVDVDGALVVTTPEPAAVLRARAAVSHALASGVESVRLVVREVAGVSADPQELAELCGAPVAGVLPYARLLTGDVARGVAPGDRRRSRLVRASRVLAREVLP